MLALLILIGLAAIAAGAWLVLRDGGPEIPDAWDPAVQDLALFVEETRGIEFVHPVSVDFLTDAEFLALVSRLGTSDPSTVGGPVELDDRDATLRALGLTDLAAGDDQPVMHGAELLARYDRDRQRIAVRGAGIDPATRAAIVHQLTSTLVDQHAGLQTSFDRPDARLAYRGLVVGDARLVERAYLAGADPEVTRAYIDRLDALRAEPASPTWLDRLAAAPQELGTALVSTILGDGGEAARDGAFEDPPDRSWHLVQPLGWVDLAAEVDAPEVPRFEGEREVGTYELGALWWFVVLAEHTAGDLALRGAGANGTDAAIVFTRDGTVCTRIAWRGAGAGDVDAMASALVAWDAARPDATVDGTDQGFVITACDPGAGNDPGTGGAARSSTLLASRAALVDTLTADGESSRSAWCLAVGVFDGLTVTDLVDGAAAGDALAARLESVRPGCAGG